jgi:hypothetical protein
MPAIEPSEELEIGEELARELAAERETAMRELCTELSFWTVCRGKRCKRFKRCEGDTEACFPRYWPFCGNMKLVIYAHMKTGKAGIVRPEIAAEMDRRLGIVRPARAMALPGASLRDDARSPGQARR